MKDLLIRARDRFARRLYEHRIDLAERARRTADRIEPEGAWEEAGESGPITFEQVKQGFLRTLFDRKIHDCPLCGRGGKLVTVSLGPADLPVLSLLASAPGDESITAAHRHHSGGISEQILFERYPSDDDKSRRIAAIGSIKRLVMFGLVERKRGGWLKLTEDGREFARGEGSAPAHCHLYGGKPLALSAESTTLAQLTLAGSGSVDESPVPAEREIHRSEPPAGPAEE